MIDGGGIKAETPGQQLSRQRVLENLGVFFAQLPKRLEPFIEELLVHYLLANAEHALPLEALQKQIDKVRNWRLKDYRKRPGASARCSASSAASRACARFVAPKCRPCCRCCRTPMR